MNITSETELIQITEEPQKIVSLKAHNFETSLKELPDLWLSLGGKP